MAEAPDYQIEHRRPGRSPVVLGHTDQPFEDRGALTAHVDRLATLGEAGTVVVASRATGDVFVEVDLAEVRRGAGPRARGGHLVTWIKDTDRDRYGTALVERLDQIEANGENERVVHMSTQVLVGPSGESTYVAQIVTFALYPTDIAAGSAMPPR